MVSSAFVSSFTTKGSDEITNFYRQRGGGTGTSTYARGGSETGKKQISFNYSMRHHLLWGIECGRHLLFSSKYSLILGYLYIDLLLCGASSLYVLRPQLAR